jgi:hypothetical protein
MKSRTTERFRRELARLPSEIQQQARRAFAQWRQDANRPSLQFRRIHSRDPIYSARIGLHWRALAVLHGDTAVWFWIGPHSEYDTMVSQL